MSPIRRVVFDTSTLVSAALREGSIPDQAFMRTINSYLLCVSREALDELESVLKRAKFDRYVSRESRKEFVELIERSTRMVAVNENEARAINPGCRDPKDNKFLALAVAAGADVIVSSDEDLLVLHPWRGIAILRPAEFVS